MKVEITSSESVKPSSPTPPHLRNFNLSACDQLNPTNYVPIVFYYPAPASSRIAIADISQRLKSSLSIHLVHFYPYAGRIKDNLSIDCNDDGVTFREAKVDLMLSEVLAHPDPLMLRMLRPTESVSAEAGTGDLFLVQANFFKCGGLALATCISHKLADYTTTKNFIVSWANLTIKPERVSEPPRVDASTYFPPMNHLITLPVVDLPKYKCVTKRYVFDSSKVSALVAMAKGKHVPKPTRAEAVCAFVWTHVTQASRSLGTFSQRTVFLQAINLRPRMSPPIPDNTVCCLATLFQVKTEEDIDIKEDGSMRKLVHKLRKRKEEFESFVKKEMVGESASKAYLRTVETLGGLMNNKEDDVYSCSCWGRSMYEADFGWGKPIWVSLVCMGLDKSIVLINEREGDGMEVWLMLRKEHMDELDRDEELLHFAALNPGIYFMKSRL